MHKLCIISRIKYDNQRDLSLSLYLSLLFLVLRRELNLDFSAQARRVRLVT